MVQIETCVLANFTAADICFDQILIFFSYIMARTKKFSKTYLVSFKLWFSLLSYGSIGVGLVGGFCLKFSAFPTNNV